MLPAPLPSMRTAALVLGHSPFALAFRYWPSKSTSLVWPFVCHAGVMLLGLGTLAAVFFELIMQGF